LFETVADRLGQPVEIERLFQQHEGPGAAYPFFDLRGGKGRHEMVGRNG